jgi:prepilin signal peptidase PulO-like enzyme (type II secretory pathway)
MLYDTVIVVVLAVLGLVTGSFLNVVILRLHAGKDFTKGRSSCPKCGHVLSPLELVPIISWLALRGRCRACGKRISIQYPLVELLTAILFVLAYITHPFGTYGELLELLLWLYVLGSLIVLAVYDIRWYLLPDKILLPLLIPAGAILLGEALIVHAPRVAIGPVLAAVAFGGSFFLLATISKGRWMGGGDIKLAIVMGLLLGLQKTALAMLIAFVSAAIIGLILIGAKRKTRQDVIPFGPFLIGGTVIAYLFGHSLIAWYGTQLGLNLL